MQYKTEYKTINGKTKKVPEKKEQDKKSDVKISTNLYIIIFLFTILVFYVIMMLSYKNLYKSKGL